MFYNFLLYLFKIFILYMLYFIKSKMILLFYVFLRKGENFVKLWSVIVNFKDINMWKNMYIRIKDIW